MNLLRFLAGTALALSILPASARALEVGDSFPSMSLTDLEGKAHDLSAMRGYVVVVYFLGSGCGLCVDIADEIESDIAGPYRDERVSIYAVDSLDGHHEDVQRLRDEAGVRYPFLLSGSALAAACGLEWHSFVILDGRGTVRYVREGASRDAYDPRAMREIIDEYVGDAVDTQLVTWGEIKRFYEGN